MYSLPEQESLLIFIEQLIPLPALPTPQPPVYAALNLEVGERSLDCCPRLGAKPGMH